MTEETARQIEADFTIIVKTLAGLPPPPGHRWTAPGIPTRWFANDVLLSVRHGASVFLRRDDFDVHDPEQVHVEARIFWSQRPGLAWRSSAYSAILWCEQGKPARRRQAQRVARRPRHLPEGRQSRATDRRAVRHPPRAVACRGDRVCTVTAHRTILPAGPALPPIAIDRALLVAAMAGAWFVFSLSGGKDSTAAAHAASLWLDTIGHPKDRRLAIHADLGRAEWETTPATVEVIAASLDVRLLVVRRRAGDLVARWEQRFLNGKRRYAALETYHLIGPWSQANKRFCTSELKTQVIGAELARRLRGATIVSVVGLRREESVARRKTVVSAPDHRFARTGNSHGTMMITWHPLVDWTAAQIFEAHRAHGWPLHEAYHCYGSTRLSCRFCVLAGLADLEASSRAPGNLDHFLHLVAMEAASTFSFQPARWLADVAPHLLPASLRRDVVRSKRDADQRRAIESNMPPALRFVQGWPPRMPTRDEARAIAGARRPILERHDLPDLFPDDDAVLDRFAELIDAQAAAAGITGRRGAR